MSQDKDQGHRLALSPDIRVANPDPVRNHLDPHQNILEKHRILYDVPYIGLRSKIKLVKNELFQIILLY